MNGKEYMIVFNPYPDAGDGDGYESIMIVPSYSANDALARFMVETHGKGYTPLKIAVVGEPLRSMTALKVVNMTQTTTYRYEVA